jgi:hypothetical protein
VAKRAAPIKIEYDDKGNPVTDNIQDDWSVEQEIEAAEEEEKRQQRSF